MSDRTTNYARGRAGSDTREERWRNLMRAAQDGDQSAYSILLSEMLPILRAVVGKRWRNRQDIEDIVQDVLLSVHSVRQTYDPARPFLPWLMTISARRIADAARRVHARSTKETTVEIMPETFAGDETKSFEQVSDDQELVRAALMALPAGQRQAIELMKLQGLSLQEASKQTGKSVASLKVTVHRAMKAMRQALKGEM
ncbi:sigma-70 family RNA polymerase sigma factor [Hyphomicrobium sp.]|uniref:RNA polymerase sigma factor n=1 Tax=Hyphomicrobium sp. TaxID=82 RepID=UPI0025C18A70|nr:sigma-70 family RNA polymerase sigma factor [Hyphomicrobium sp.]